MTTQTLPSAAESSVSAKVSCDQALRCAFYCEENVWRLAYRKRYTRDHRDREEFHVVFISNARKCVPMFHQRASSSPANKPCTWDYHVILIGIIRNSRANGVTFLSPLVYDVDTTLSYPVALDDYLDGSFPGSVPTCFAPLFRIVSAENYLCHFGSDRRHMFDAVSNQWSVAPPSYRCILPAVALGDIVEPDAVDENKQTVTLPVASFKHCDAPIVSTKNNLAEYLNFDQSGDETSVWTLPTDALGSILTLQQLQQHW